MRNIAKSVLALVLSLTILVGPCFAADLGEGDISEAFSADMSMVEYATKNEVLNALNKLFGNNDPDGDLFQNTEVATYRFFLDKWCEMSQNQFFYKAEDGNYIYPMEDAPGFLTQEEWLVLTADLDAFIPNTVVLNTCSKGKFAHYALGEFYNFDFKTSEEYFTFVYLFAPELSKIIEEDGLDEAVEYWLSPSEDYHSSFMHHEASIIMHELQHEASARRCNLFRGREYCSDKSWVVYWGIYGVMKDITYFDPVKEDFVSLKQVGIFKDHEPYYTDAVPERVKELWEPYFEYGTASHDKGLPGILQEWSSAAVGLRMEAVLVSMNRPFICMMGMADDALFWKAYMMSYLAWSKDNDPQMYERFLNDFDTLELIVDLGIFCQYQLDTCKEITETTSYRVAKEWAESEVVESEWEEVLSTYQKMSSKRDSGPWAAIKNGVATYRNTWISGVGQLAACASELLHVA